MPGGLAHAVTARTSRPDTPAPVPPQSTVEPGSPAERDPGRKAGRSHEGMGAPSTGARRIRAEVLAPLLLGAMVGSLVAGRFETGALCVAASITATALSGGWPGAGWLRLLATSAVLSMVLNLYLNPGSPLPVPAIGRFRPTYEGLANGGLLVLRMTGAGVAVLGLRALWRGERAADEIAALAAPLERLGVPVRRARATISLALRFVPLVQDEIGRVARMQALRAGRPPRGAREWLERQRAAFVPAMVGCLERADRVALALEARHYRLRPVSRGPRSPWLATGAGVALAAAALIWR